MYPGENRVALAFAKRRMEAIAAEVGCDSAMQLAVRHEQRRIERGIIGWDGGHGHTFGSAAIIALNTLRHQ